MSHHTERFLWSFEIFGLLWVECDFDYHPGRPGFIGGPPERCYPDEPPELEIQSVKIVGSRELCGKGEDSIDRFLSPDEIIDISPLLQNPEFRATLEYTLLSKQQTYEDYIPHD
jgi:hypothetical protein